MAVMTGMKLKIRIGLLLLSLAPLAIVAAQKPDPERIAALKQSIAENQAALKTYKWTEATEISLKGEVKKREQKECRYGPDGKVQKTPIGGGDAAEKKEEKGGGGRRGGGGAVKKVVVKNKVEDMKEYMEKAAALVHELSLIHI